jgi:glutathione S-transferase
MNLTLYADSRLASPWVLSVWVALKEKNLSFKLITFDLEAGEHLQGDYRDQVLTGKIPGLKHDDFFLGESQAIIEYLEDVFPAPKYKAVFPNDPKARAYDRQVMSWLRTDLAELRKCLSFEGIVQNLPAKDLTPQATKQALKLLVAAEAYFDKFPVSGQLTMGGFDIGCTLQRLAHYGYFISNYPPLEKAAAQIWQHPSVKSWVDAKRT